MHVDSAVAAWALARMRQQPRLWAELCECEKRYNRQFGKLTKTERVLRADPVSDIIGLTALIDSVGSSVVGFGSTFAIAGISSTAIGGAIIGIGISVGINYASSLLRGNGTSPLVDSGVSPGDVNSAPSRYNERQAIPSQRIIYGQAQVGGALFFENTAKPFLYQGLLLCAKPITAIVKVWIGTQEVSFANFAMSSILTPIATLGQPDYPNHLLLSLRRGDADQAADLLLQTPSGIQPATGGTAIGNMTSGGGLAAAFDGVTNKATSLSCEALGTFPTFGVSGNVGKDWGSGFTKTIEYFVFTIPTDAQPFPTNMYLEGSNDNFSTVVQLWSSIGNAYDPGSFAIQTEIDTSTAYRYHRLRIDGFIIVAVSQLALYEFGSSTSLFDAPVPADMTQFRQQGIATAVLRYDFGADQTEFTALWGQVQRPNPLFLVQGIAIPDPRIAGHILDWDPNDADSVAAAEASWQYSNNASLVQAHYLTQRYGGRIDPQRIDWDKVASAANWDDGLQACNDGTFIKRHTIDGVVTLDQSPSDVLAAMLTANRGFVLESAGNVWVSSSLPRTPIATITDNLLTGAVAYQSAKAKRDLVNRVKTQFIAAELQYQSAVGPIYSREDLQAEDGEILDATLSLPFTLDNRRVQRLSKAYLETARLGRTITCVCDVSLIANAGDELIGNAVNFDSVLFAQMNGVYFVLNWGFSDNAFSSISLSLTEYDPSIETDWNASVDEQPFTLATMDQS